MSANGQPLRVLVVACFDSFLRAGAAFARRLEARGATVDYALVFARPAQISPAQFRGMGFSTPIPSTSLEQITQRRRLERTDLVILCLGSLRTRRFMSRFRQLFEPGDPARPITVSLFPGLLFRAQYESWMSRMSCDLLLLNSPHEVSLYDEMTASLKEPSRAMCGGLSFLPSLAGVAPRATGTRVVFVGQPTVPAGRLERAFVIDRMIALAERHPEVPFVIKPRHRPTETTLHQVRHHYADLLASAGRVPENLTLSYEPMSTVLEDTRVCLTFSSTAALEALALGVPTRVLTDIGISEEIGNTYFMGSGLSCDFADVTPELDYRVDRKWLEQHAASADDRFEEIYARIVEMTERRAETRPDEPALRLFGRSAAFTQFVEARSGWQALERFGDAGRGTLSRVREVWAPLYRTLLARLDRQS